MKNKKRGHSVTTTSYRQIFSVCNPQHQICNRFAPTLYQKNKTATIALMFLAVFILPYQIQANLKSTDTSTERNFDFSTTQISYTFTNILEDETISTTILYSNSDLPLLPKKNAHNQGDYFSGLVSNNIIFANERSTKANIMENLEQSIRNSVKSEIEAEQHSEPSQVMEILKELTDPEIRKTLAADLISLDNINQNSLVSSVEKNAFLKNESISETDLLSLPKTEDILEPGQERNENKANNTIESMNILSNYLIKEHDVGITDSITDKSDQNQHKSNNLEQLWNSTTDKSQTIYSTEISSIPQLSEINEPEANKVLYEHSGNNSSNEFVSVTFHETIAGIPMNYNEENTLNDNEFIFPNEQDVIKENKNNNTEDGHFGHIVIKKVLNVQENSDTALVTTFRPYSEKELTSNDQMDSLDFNLDQALIHGAGNNLNLNDSIVKEKLNNNVNINQLNLKSHTQNDLISTFTYSSYDNNIKNISDSNEVLNKNSELPEEKFGQKVVTPYLLTNSDIKKFQQNISTKPINDTMSPLTNNDINRKTEADTYYQSNINFNIKNEIFTPNSDIEYDSNTHDKKATKFKTTFTDNFSLIPFKLNVSYTEQNLKTMLLQNSKTLVEDSKEHNPQKELDNELKKSFSNTTKVLNALKDATTANAKDFPEKFDEAVATLLQGYPPQDAGQTLNDNLADEIIGIGKTLPVSITDRFNTSAIIILSSGTACLLVLASVTIFLMLLQRQNGTLNIEMQERSCGKDNLDEEDAQTFAMLLEVDLSPSVAIALDESEECL